MTCQHYYVLTCTPSTLETHGLFASKNLRAQTRQDASVFHELLRADVAARNAQCSEADVKYVHEEEASLCEHETRAEVINWVAGNPVRQGNVVKPTHGTPHRTAPK